jgi:hypothetical protein
VEYSCKEASNPAETINKVSLGFAKVLIKNSSILPSIPIPPSPLPST